MSLPPRSDTRPKTGIVMEYEVRTPSTNPVDLLDQTFKLIKRDLDKYEEKADLSEAQARIVRDHGRFLVEANKEQRQASKEAAANAGKMSDDDLREVLRDPNTRAHLKQMIEEYDEHPSES